MVASSQGTSFPFIQMTSDFGKVMFGRLLVTGRKPARF